MEWGGHSLLRDTKRAYVVTAMMMMALSAAG